MSLVFSGQMHRAQAGDDAFHALHHLRAHHSSLRSRIDLLSPSDRVLMELVPTGMRSIRQVARMLNENPGALSRRMRLLWQRLNHPMITHLMSGSCLLPSEYRQIGVERYMLGMSFRQIAEKHRMSPTDTKKMLAYLRGYAKARGIYG